jgi:hypothetical protein
LEKIKRIPAGMRFSLEIKKEKVLRLEHLFEVKGDSRSVAGMTNRAYL